MMLRRVRERTQPNARRHLDRFEKLVRTHLIFKSYDTDPIEADRLGFSTCYMHRWTIRYACMRPLRLIMIILANVVREGCHPNVLYEIHLTRILIETSCHAWGHLAGCFKRRAWPLRIASCQLSQLRSFLVIIDNNHRCDYLASQDAMNNVASLGSFRVSGFPTHLGCQELMSPRRCGRHTPRLVKSRTS